MKNKTHKWFSTPESGISFNGKVGGKVFVVTNYEQDYKENGKRVYYTNEADANNKAKELNENK